MESITTGVDISKYKTAAGAAKAVHRIVKECADWYGHDPEIETYCKKRNGVWTVGWEAGPMYWAVELTGGEPIFGPELEVTGIYDNPNVDVECKNSFTLEFYD